MVLEGTVTNVAAFGAFVDLGVHQDGLVHVSAMSDSFVSDPHDVVSSGQVVKVKVMEVDVDRQRIGLSLRLQDEPGEPASKRNAGDRQRGGRKGSGPGAGRGQGGQGRQGGQGGRGNRGRNGGGQKPGQAAGGATGSMADALKRAGFGR
jgi:uncharacterized protein